MRRIIRTQANTGKYSWRIIYVLVSCEGVMPKNTGRDLSRKVAARFACEAAAAQLATYHRPLNGPFRGAVCGPRGGTGGAKPGSGVQRFWGPLGASEFDPSFQ